jgi:hypothetical protein
MKYVRLAPGARTPAGLFCAWKAEQITEQVRDSDLSRARTDSAAAPRVWRESAEQIPNISCSENYIDLR